MGVWHHVSGTKTTQCQAVFPKPPLFFQYGTETASLHGYTHPCHSRNAYRSSINGYTTPVNGYRVSVNGYRTYRKVYTTPRKVYMTPRKVYTTSVKVYTICRKVYMNRRKVYTTHVKVYTTCRNGSGNDYRTYGRFALANPPSCMLTTSHTSSSASVGLTETKGAFSPSYSPYGCW
jgi:hypothetical protein